MLEYQERARQHYTETLDNLSRINNSISMVYNALMQHKAKLEHFIHWIVGFLGGTGWYQYLLYCEIKQGCLFAPSGATKQTFCLDTEQKMWLIALQLALNVTHCFITF